MNLLLVNFIAVLAKKYDIVKIDKNNTSFYRYDFDIRCFSHTYAKQFNLWLYLDTNEVYYSGATIFEHCGYFSNKIENDESQTTNCLKAVDAILAGKL